MIGVMVDEASSTVLLPLAFHFKFFIIQIFKLDNI